MLTENEEQKWNRLTAITCQEPLYYLDNDKKCRGCRLFSICNLRKTRTANKQNKTTNTDTTETIKE